MFIRMKKEFFIKYLEHLHRLEDAIYCIEDNLDTEITDGIIGNVLDDHVAILADACLGDRYYWNENLKQELIEWFYWFCYDNDFGNKSLTIQDKEKNYYSVDSIEAFYDVLNELYNDI